jgi:uncharacterized protein DUF6851/vanadium-dependent haloperoxidase-like protein
MNVLRTTRKGIFGILVMLVVFHTSFARSATFDFDNGNAITEVIIPKGNQVILNSALSPSASDATLVLRITTLTNNAWFDAIAPYHPTAVGVYSRLGRRPASESTTNRNKNIAMLYATYRVGNSLFPQNAADWREMLTSVGLDPDDAQENTNTAIGIGNSAGNAVVEAREHDGMNQLGDESGREYNRRPYADYLGYKPVNTAYKLRNPSRWQPNIITKGNGIFQVQQFVTPQMRVTLPYSYDDPNRFRAPFPTDSQVQNLSAYIRQADEVLAASAALTDYEKMVAEFFNDKFASLGATGFFAAQAAHLNLDQFVQHNFLINLAAFDTAIAVWNEKYRYDSVRPFSAIRFIYRDRPVTAWGGVGKGTVTDIPASQWKSYLDVADHPEYPSGSASLCSAQAQASRRFLGSDILGMSVPVAKGSSRVEPGITPAQNIVLGPWETLTEWEQECGLSRLWGGVHFMAAINAGHEIGQLIGNLAYEFVQKHIDGQAAPFHAVVR